jgi:hypothetical protein
MQDENLYPSRIRTSLPLIEMGDCMVSSVRTFTLEYTVLFGHLDNTAQFLKIDLKNRLGRI